MIFASVLPFSSYPELKINRTYNGAGAKTRKSGKFSDFSLVQGYVEHRRHNLKTSLRSEIMDIFVTH